MKIGFIGLGKLGMPCAEVLAQNYDVCGYDSDTSRSSSILRISKNLSDAVLNRELVFVAVPTPHHRDYDGSLPSSHLPKKDFDYTVLQQVVQQIAEVDPKATVVIISTVLPGIIRSRLKPLLPAGILIYNPYFISMGNVKEDFLHPEMIPIGTSDSSEVGAEPLVRLYKHVTPNARIELGTYEEAESIKIFYNTFLSFKIGFVNTILDVALKVGHIDVDRVTTALAKSTKRLMSSAYTKAGMGDGGPCHPRDNIALSDLAHRLDLGYDIFGALMQSREAQAKNLAQFLGKFQLPVVLVGVSFKPDSPLTDGSYSLLIAHYLREAGATIHLFDPAAGFEGAFDKTDCAVLLAHTHLYEAVRPRLGLGSIVVDPWRSDVSKNDFRTILYGNTRGLE